MEQLVQSLSALGVPFQLVLIAGMIRRGRLGNCYAFTASVAVSTLCTAFFVLSPDLYTPEAFMVKQGVYDSLVFGMALEIACRTFGAFRGIARWGRGLLASTVAVSSLGVFLLTPPALIYADVGKYQPGITTAGIWCLTFVALFVVWYQIPIPSFTRAIILGYVPYLVVFVVCEDLIGWLGWGNIDGINAVNALAYLAAIGYLAYSAWSHDRSDGVGNSAVPTGA